MIEKTKPKAKIIGFPQKSADLEAGKTEAAMLEELKSILKVDAKPVKTRKKAPTMAAVTTSSSSHPPISVNINFNGGNNQFAAGNLSISSQTESVKRSASDIPGAISKAQKKVLLDLRNEVVEKSALCGFPRHPGAVMKELNAHIGVVSYHGIRIEDFNKAKGYLDSYIANYGSYLNVLTFEKVYRAALWESIKSAQALLPVGSEVHTKITVAIHQDNLGCVETAELKALLDLAVSSAF